MTDQEIIGLMQNFYIAKKGSRIANYHNKEVEKIAKTFAVKDCSIEFSHKNVDDEKFFSIRSFTNEDGITEYITGSGVPFDSEDLIGDIENKLMSSITQEEYLQKYRELEEEQ